MLTRKYTHVRRIKRDPLELPRPARVMRMSCDGSVIFSDWYYKTQKAKVMAHVLNEYKDEYPFLFIAGRQAAIIPPEELGFFKRVHIDKIQRIVRTVYAANGNYNTPVEFANLVLLFLVKGQYQAVTDRRHRPIIKDKKFNGSKARAKKYGKLVQ